MIRKCPDLPKIVHRAPDMACLGRTLLVSISSDAADFQVIADGSTVDSNVLQS